MMQDTKTKPTLSPFEIKLNSVISYPFECAPPLVVYSVLVAILLTLVVVL